MTPTVTRGLRGLPVPQEQIQSWINEELLIFLRQVRQAANYTAITNPTLPTAGTGVYTTIWTSADLAVGTAVLIDATIVGVASTARSAFKITGLFYNNGTTAQEGVTVAGYTQNAAGFAVQFLVVSNHVELQVKDAGGLTVDWDALVVAQEAT